MDAWEKRISGTESLKREMKNIIRDNELQQEEKKVVSKKEKLML